MALEDLQYAGLKIIQDDRVFRFGTDAVLLAAFADVRKRDDVADLGAGSGILTLLLSPRTQGQLYAVEIQEHAAALARENMRLNGLEDRATVIEGDMRHAYDHSGRRVHAVICNPPYDKPGSGGSPQARHMRLARHEVACDLDAVCQSAASLLGMGGRFYMIHRASRLPDVLCSLREHDLEPKVLRLVQSRAGAAPKYALIKSVRGAGRELRILENLILLDEKGRYTAEAAAMYHLKEEGT